MLLENQLGSVVVGWFSWPEN